MIQKHSVTIDDLNMTISTGDLAQLASGSVTITVGETCVFVSATAANTVREGQDWFPLTVDYREKFSAAGRIPGGYFKREARPTQSDRARARAQHQDQQAPAAIRPLSWWAGGRPLWTLSV